MLHLHLGHQHQWCQTGDGEVFDVVVRRLLRRNKEDLVITYMELAGPGVCIHVVFTVHLCRQCRNDLHCLQKLVSL